MAEYYNKHTLLKNQQYSSVNKSHDNTSASHLVRNVENLTNDTFYAISYTKKTFHSTIHVHLHDVKKTSPYSPTLSCGQVNGSTGNKD